MFLFLTDGLPTVGVGAVDSSLTGDEK